MTDDLREYTVDSDDIEQKVDDDQLSKMYALGLSYFG